MKNLYLALAAASLLTTTACKKTEDPGPAEEAAKTAAINRYAELALNSYDEALKGAQNLQTVVGSFLEAPSQAGLDVARKAWIDARAPYSRTETFRFYGGPIDGDGGPEGLINCWPLDESYVDYVQGQVDTISIIATTDPSLITPDFISGKNGVGGETNVATGYHAIEFLLWGQDLSANLAGQRPYTDYTTEEHAEARKAYLRAACSLLVSNLMQVRDAWQPGASYRTTFTSKPAKEALSDMFHGMGALAKAETGGERTRVALASGSQEDEQSCFSDNTKADIVNNIQGILNVYNGVFQPATGPSTEGPSSFDAIAKKDAPKAQAVRSALNQALADANNIPQRFDQAIAPGNADGHARVQATADQLSKSADAIVNAAAVYGITVSAEGN